MIMILISIRGEILLASPCQNIWTACKKDRGFTGSEGEKEFTFILVFSHTASVLPKQDSGGI